MVFFFFPLIIFPTCFAGLPITTAKSLTFFVTTDPAPIIDSFPILLPHIIVQLAPKVAPF